MASHRAVYNRRESGLRSSTHAAVRNQRRSRQTGDVRSRRWGARTLGPPKDDDELYPEWGLNWCCGTRLRASSRAPWAARPRSIVASEY